jgi:hypothetical protein
VSRRRGIEAGDSHAPTPSTYADAPFAGRSWETARRHHVHAAAAARRASPPDWRTGSHGSDRSSLSIALRDDGSARAVASFSIFMAGTRPAQVPDEVVDVIASGWPDGSDLFKSGVAVFDELTSDGTVPRKALWAAIVSVVRNAVSPHAAILLLKAFPLEWECCPAGFSPAGSLRHARRQAAMLHHYQRHLGAMPIFPASCGGVWMWTGLSVAVAPPIFTTDDLRGYGRDLVEHSIDPHGLRSL